MIRVNRLDRNHLEAWHADVVATARALMERKIPLVDGVRRLLGLRFNVSALDHDPDFMLFVAIDSQTNHLPSAEARAGCSQSWLDQCDGETNELEDTYAVQVASACERLIARFSKPE